MKRLALPLLLLAAAACSRGADPSVSAAATAPPVATPAATSATPTPKASSAPSPEAYRMFLSPTRNIGCGITSGNAACDIREKTWSPPSKPASCEFEWGNGLYLTTTASPATGFACSGDSVINDDAAVLPYGQRTTLGSITCESREDGVRCVDAVSRHGFLIGKASYDLF